MILTLLLSFFLFLFSCLFFPLAAVQRIKFPRVCFWKGLAYFIFARSSGLERQLSSVPAGARVQEWRGDSLNGVLERQHPEDS